ncbi:calcium/sodium antiporter [Candidatus Woesearchaeota archaeon]|jgi:cation:H+ antiporter|nr:calcium/sodium antiporter [Candidatus Woesearchaeota archaeon]MBT6735345.1 calcium/sodium antiporter [Candidatus Woesearchaeota archaeon]MBT7169679.1 calcium/sodium antiporter [Candidatus Woesearchaeota archaeon]
MGILLSLGIIILTSIVIYFAGNKFAESSSKIGDYFNLPRDVKGATFDAIASSLPELLVALYSVVIFKQFEVGVGTITGSALFNLLIIPGICVFVAPKAFKVSKKVLSRDALYYMVSVFTLLVLLIYFKTWGLIISLLLLVIYLLYVKDIIIHTREHKKKNKPKKTEHINFSKELLIFFTLIGIIGIFTFFLTDSAINLAHALGIAPIIIAFTVIAAATSIPDTIISVVNAKKGNIDDATSNVFGSNIFDILVGLGLPLFIYSLYKGAVEITFTNIEIVLSLLGSTMLVLYFFGDDHTLCKKEAAVLLIMYFIFVAYVISLAVI